MNVREYGNKPENNTIDVTTKWTKFTLSKEMRYMESSGKDPSIQKINSIAAMYI
jgi:hypothetical protein